jgi:hypothetical protein
MTVYHVHEVKNPGSGLFPVEHSRVFMYDHSDLHMIIHQFIKTFEHDLPDVCVFVAFTSFYLDVVLFEAKKTCLSSPTCLFPTRTRKEYRISYPDEHSSTRFIRHDGISCLHTGARVFR